MAADHAETGGQDELISVIVPAFNASRFIDRTIASIVSQSHRAIEVLIVDDGSTDDTAARVRSWMSRDTRIALISGTNAGVAAARNAGIAAARGRYIAPVDADDLWAPDKIERQLAAATSLPGEPAGLVYGWYVQIDEHDRIFRHYHDMPAPDRLLEGMCRNNVIGSGSLPLLLRRAVEEAGGYDPSLRARQAQGCEDYKLYVSILERYPAAMVPAYLCGYRIHRSSMSSNVEAMARSRAIVTGEIAARHPEWRRRLEHGNIRVMRFTLSRLIHNREWHAARALLAMMLRTDARTTAYEVAAAARLMARGAIEKVAVRLGLKTQHVFAIGSIDAHHDTNEVRA